MSARCSLQRSARDLLRTVWLAVMPQEAELSPLSVTVDAWWVNSNVCERVRYMRRIGERDPAIASSTPLSFPPSGGDKELAVSCRRAMDVAPKAVAAS